MKKFIKSKLFPVAVLAVVEISLLVLLYCNGFRITYAPDLENSWDAVSAIAAWGGVFMSFVAIMVAIQIPKKIADRQDKIALFEKRLEIYDILLSCSSSAEALNDIEEDKSVLKYFFIIFRGDEGEYQEFNRDEAKLYFKNCATKLLRASFFFPEEIASYIINVSGELFILTYSNPETDGPGKYRKKSSGILRP